MVGIKSYSHFYFKKSPYLLKRIIHLLPTNLRRHIAELETAAPLISGVPAGKAENISDRSFYRWAPSLTS